MLFYLHHVMKMQFYHFLFGIYWIYDFLFQLVEHNFYSHFFSRVWMEGPIFSGFIVCISLTMREYKFTNKTQSVEIFGTNFSFFTFNFDHRMQRECDTLPLPPVRHSGSYLFILMDENPFFSSALEWWMFERIRKDIWIMADWMLALADAFLFEFDMHSI